MDIEKLYTNNDNNEKIIEIKINNNNENIKNMNNRTIKFTTGRFKPTMDNTSFQNSSSIDKSRRPININLNSISKEISIKQKNNNDGNNINESNEDNNNSYNSYRNDTDDVHERQTH